MKLTIDVQALNISNMYTVFDNLISNTIKFTPKEGNISILIKNTSKKMVVNIDDSGIGMSETQPQKLFNVKDSNSTLGTNNEIRSGLRVIITKELLEQNNGSIEVKSNLSLGSTFILKLPKKA